MKNIKYNLFSMISTVLLFASEAGGGGSAKAKTSVTKTRAPLGDLSKMSQEELLAIIEKQQSELSQSTTSVHSFRFNNGTEPTFYAEGDDLKDRRTGKLHAVGDLKSPRDSGTFSLYGFGRNPISVYPNQAIEMAVVLMDGILPYIKDNQAAIDAYLATRPNFRNSNKVAITDLEGVLSRWSVAKAVDQESETPDAEGTETPALVEGE